MAAPLSWLPVAVRLVGGGEAGTAQKLPEIVRGAQMQGSIFLPPQKHTAPCRHTTSSPRQLQAVGQRRAQGEASGHGLRIGAGPALRAGPGRRCEGNLCPLALVPASGRPWLVLVHLSRLRLCVFEWVCGSGRGGQEAPGGCHIFPEREASGRPPLPPPARPRGQPDHPAGHPPHHTWTMYAWRMAMYSL